MASEPLTLQAYTRDGYTCQECGYTGEPGHNGLHAHHILPSANGGADSLDNLVTLCNKCHRLRHRQLREELSRQSPTAPVKHTAFRLTTDDLAILARLRERLGLDSTSTIRYALRRVAQMEAIEMDAGIRCPVHGIVEGATFGVQTPAPCGCDWVWDDDGRSLIAVPHRDDPLS